MVIIKVVEREKEQRSSFNFRAGPTLKKLRTQRIQAMTNNSKELAARDKSLAINKNRP
jgi:hypothetical protein